MKTRFLIIIGIIIAITISVSSLIIIDNIEAQSKFPPLRDDPNAPDELRVILQLCEKPWEDRGLNQQYRNQTHHLDTHNCVWKYNFDKIDWSNNPTKKFEETSLRLVLHACSSWIESKNGREPLAYSNETHFINTKNCELKIIERGSFGMLLFEENRNELQQVLDYCNDTSGIKNFILYNYSNETHSINNNTCEWKQHGTFPNTDNLCIPYSDQWFTGEEIRNQTHIFLTDSCTWRIDQDFDTVNSKGCPQFCPKDDTIEKTLDNLPSETNSLRPGDKLKVSHTAGYTSVGITLSSWDEYNEWESKRGPEHDRMPPIQMDDSNANPILVDLLNEMWTFEDYEVSKWDDTLFVKTIQKDYSVPNHHGIIDWLKSEYVKQFGESQDGTSHFFEYQDKVYTVIMVAYD